MLPAYFTTIATNKPPVAWSTTKYQMNTSYPKKKPFEVTAFQSYARQVKRPKGSDKTLSCMLRIHTETVEPFGDSD